MSGYWAGDLEGAYATLEVEEDLLYAYGFLPRRVWRLLHPRRTSPLTALEKKVLATVRERGPVHPRDLEATLGKKRVVNAWGGFSKATTHALDRLQIHGHLRVARRDAGIRVYEPAPEHEDRSADERLREILRIVAALLAPVRKKTLQSIGARTARWIGARPPNVRNTVVRDLGLESATIDHVEWLWRLVKEMREHEAVRFLAPFDPIVWDRARFEQLWGWTYRFEAYTPVKKRVRGYYAMPLLWRDAVIGWANASHENGKTNVDVGFVKQRPRDRTFTRELDAEIARLEEFLSARRRNRASPR